MNKSLIFLIISTSLLVLSAVVICVSPIINNIEVEVVLEYDSNGEVISNYIWSPSSWRNLNCKILADKEKADTVSLDDIQRFRKYKNICYRQKAMYGLEYSSLIIDVILGFICTILGLLHYFDIAKPFEKISGIIGLATGIIDFILTLVYICYSGYIFTNDITTGFDNYDVVKLDKEGAFAEWDDSKGQYKCIFYKSNKPNSIYAKYNDLGKRQYNYEKKRFYDRDTKYTSCLESYNSMSTTSHTGANCK